MTPTDEAPTRAAEELIERTAVARGLPRHVTEPAVLARVAVLLRPDGTGHLPLRRRRLRRDVDAVRVSQADRRTPSSRRSPDEVRL
jgi:hypothetical protein